MPWQKVNELGNDPSYLEPRVTKNTQDIANLNEEVNDLENGMTTVVKSVNGSTPDENGNVTIDIPNPDLTGYVTTEELNGVQDNIDNHKKDGTAHGIGDKETLQTVEKTTIVGAINELFTNVSNGKQIVGTAITDKDSNVVVPTDPTFQDLAIAIGQIESGGGGMKSFSGSVTSSGSTMNFYSPSNGQSGSFYISLSGLSLDFTPIMAFVIPSNRTFDLGFLTIVYPPSMAVINPNNVSLTSSIFITPVNGTTGSVRDTGQSYRLFGNAVMSNESVILPVRLSNSSYDFMLVG